MRTILLLALVILAAGCSRSQHFMHEYNVQDPDTGQMWRVVVDHETERVTAWDLGRWILVRDSEGAVQLYTVRKN